MQPRIGFDLCLDMFQGLKESDKIELLEGWFRWYQISSSLDDIIDDSIGYTETRSNYYVLVFKLSVLWGKKEDWITKRMNIFHYSQKKWSLMIYPYCIMCTLSYNSLFPVFFLFCYLNNTAHTHTHKRASRELFNQQDLPGLQPSVPASLVSLLTPVPDWGRIANFLWIGFFGAGLHAFALPEFTK